MWRVWVLGGLGCVGGPAGAGIPVVGAHGEGSPGCGLGCCCRRRCGFLWSASSVPMPGPGWWNRDGDGGRAAAVMTSAAVFTGAGYGTRCGGGPETADRGPQTADRRPQTGDRRPGTADRGPGTGGGRLPPVRLYSVGRPDVARPGLRCPGDAAGGRQGCSGDGAGVLWCRCHPAGTPPVVVCVWCPVGVVFGGCGVRWVWWVWWSGLSGCGRTFLCVGQSVPGRRGTGRGAGGELQGHAAGADGCG